MFHSKRLSTAKTSLLTSETTELDVLYNQRSTSSAPPRSSDDLVFTSEIEHHKQPECSSTLSAWGYEFAAVTFSLICFATTIAILVKLDGATSSDWHVQGYAITPNALISILTTQLRAALLLVLAAAISQLKWRHFQKQEQRLWDIQVFDDASRGPIGSVAMIWSINHRAILACLGALMVLLTFAVEPFNQQLLTYRPRNDVTQDGIASIGAITALDISRPSVDVSDYETKTSIWAVQWRAAVLQGLTEPVTLRHQCSTGDCQWTAFDSIGVSATCTDVTHSLEVSCTELSTGVSEHVQLNAPEIDNQTLNLTSFCTYDVGLSHTPSSVSNMSSDLRRKTRFWNAWIRATPPEKWLPVTRMNVSVDAQHITDRDGNGLVATLVAIHFNQSYDGSLVAEDILPSTTVCKLSYAIQSRKPEIKNGVLFDVPTKSVPMKITNESLLISWSQRPSSLADPLLLCYAADVPEPVIPALNPPDQPSLSHAPNDTNTYWINEGIYRRNIAPVLEETMSAVTFNQDLGEYLNARHAIPVAFEAELNRTVSSGYVSMTSQYYVGDGNLTTTISNIATSLTNMMQQGQGSYSETGTVWKPTIFVVVQWYWLIYPGTVTLLTITFFVITIVSSRQAGIPIWKSSSLAVAMHGYRTLDQQETQRRDLQEMESFAKSSRAHMTADELGRIAMRQHEVA